MALEQHLPKSEMLFFGQDKTDALYVIASGSVQLIDESQGYEQSLTVFSRYEFIGNYSSRSGASTNIFIQSLYRRNFISF
jgi:CRP-like cAMP-binding protein